MKTYPGEDGEKGEGDGCPGGVTSLAQRVVVMIGHLPLVGQEAETHEPHEGPERWRWNKINRNGFKQEQPPHLTNKPNQSGKLLGGG